jgi:hypothetical protein
MMTLWRAQHEDKDSSGYNTAELAPLLEKIESRWGKNKNKI